VLVVRDTADDEHDRDEFARSGARKPARFLARRRTGLSVVPARLTALDSLWLESGHPSSPFQGGPVPNLRPVPAPSTPPAPPRPRSLLMENARAVSGKLHALFAARRKNMAQIAHELATMRRGELFSYLGYASVFAYAWTEHAMGKSKVSELIGISEASDRLPKTREAFDGGKLHWTKAREITKVATAETEGDWLALADASTSDELRAARKGEPAPRRRVLALPDEQAALYDQLVAGARAELGFVPEWQVVLELMKRGASGQRGDAPVQRVVITACPTCREATTEAREGSVPVSEAALDHALCDGEVHDLRDEENPVTQAIPRRIRRRVLDRDRHRCRVPGCSVMAALQVHHEDGRENGHDPDRMLALCQWSVRHQSIGRLSSPPLASFGSSGRPGEGALGGPRARCRQLHASRTSLHGGHNARIARRSSRLASDDDACANRSIAP